MQYDSIVKLLNKDENAVIFYTFSREEIENKSLKRTTDLFKTLVKVGANARNKVVFACDGYDDDTRELFDIDEVRAFMSKLFKRYPYIVYFVNQEVPDGVAWMLNSWLDGESFYKGEQLNAYDLFAKYGADTPKFQSRRIMSDEQYTALVNETRKLGKKLKDTKGAEESLQYYITTFKR